MSEYQERILEIINASEMPLDTETIRKQVGIANWSTANRMLLELAMEGKIEALKTSKSWVFSKKNNNGDGE